MFFNIGITKFILGEFLRILTECLINSFNDTFNNIHNKALCQGNTPHAIAAGVSDFKSNIFGTTLTAARSYEHLLP